MTTAAAPPTTTRARVAELTAALITRWQEGYLNDRPGDVAALARLRRGAGRDAGDVPDLWGLVDTGALHTRTDSLRPLSEQELVRAENAVYAALTLWALHQQSRGTRMHRPSRQGRQSAGLGAAVRRLMPAGGIDEAVRKRLVRAGTAPDLVGLAQRLRDIVVLLRRADIPLDYGLLAGQLYAWQWPDGPSAVRREWGRSFHAWQPAAPSEDTNPNPTTDTDKDAS